ncbi:MAG: protein phosphatase 2C domain-containing protein [Selenomonadaceae bacterium]|nr:protein phosphatase 2C domain-containing protein [Selenomonadaceae bacterium]
MENQSNSSERELIQYTSSLWKYKSISAEIPESEKEYINESHTIGDFQVIAARVRGKKHKQDGSNCDDWFETENIDGIFVSAVSDGAGSKKFSRIGAKKSCKAAVAFLKINLLKILKKNPNLRENLCKDMKNHMFLTAAGTLANLVAEATLAARLAVVKAYEERKLIPRYKNIVGRPLELKDFSATFLLTLAMPLDEIGEVLVITFQIGDGVTATLNIKESFEKALTVFGTPDSGQFGGETDFLTNPKCAVKANLTSRIKLSRKPVDILFSMTDGVADDYYPNEKQLFRLYFDLVANRILPPPKNISESDLENLNVPPPQIYPRIDADLNKKPVSIQYTEELVRNCGLTLKNIWENPAPLVSMARKIFINEHSATGLQEWLDNYTVRGSFDDRTLVILRKRG